MMNSKAGSASEDIATFTRDQLSTVEREFEVVGLEAQIQRDVLLWKETLTHTTSTTNLEKSRIEILQRIFLVLKHGGLLYRASKSDDNGWKFWADTSRPIATALSHGSRVIIQLPKVRTHSQKVTKPAFLSAIQKQLTSENSSYDHSFWNWLITGRMQGNLSEFVSTSNTGDDAEKENKILFKRLAATHALKYWNSENVNSMLTSDKPKRIQISKSSTFEDKVKYIYEIKDLGLNPRNTKLGTQNAVLHHHRHWGMNVSIGGLGNIWDDTVIQSNGQFGHVYIYYMSPAVHRYGGIMIGVEGSEYGKMDRAGGDHTISAKSCPVGITQGLKWDRLKKKGVTNVPDKYDSMFIDLSDGWSFLLSKTFTMDMIGETSDRR